MICDSTCPTSSCSHPLTDTAIQGSTPRPDLGSLGGLSQAWTVPCDTEFSFGIVVGSQTFSMDQSALVVQQPDGTCISGIEGWTDANQIHTVYGQRVIHTLYMCVSQFFQPAGGMR